jgi:hypothetical protein
MITRNLFVVPEPRRFGPDAEKELAAGLARLERTTQVKQVSRVEELCLDGEMARDAVNSCPARVKFHEAILAGRRLMVRYVHARPLFEADAPSGVDAFHGGYHFSNSEVAGEASVKAAVLLANMPGGTASLGLSDRGKLAHTGKDFGKRLAKMFGAVLAVPQDAADLRRRVEALRALPLGLGGDTARRDAQLEYLTIAIHGQDVNRSSARRIAVSAMSRGAHDPPNRHHTPSREVLASRDAYDLYRAMTREAVDLPLAAREPIERAAYDLLTGKFRLKTER